jgi:hypothetical protein
MSNFDNFLKTIGGITLLILLLVFFVTYQNFLIVSALFILGLWGYTNLTFKSKYLPIENLLFSLITLLGVLICSLPIALVIFYIFRLMFSFGGDAKWAVFKVIVIFLCVVSATINYLRHRDKS